MQNLKRFKSRPYRKEDNLSYQIALGRRSSPGWTRVYNGFVTPPNDNYLTTKVVSDRRACHRPAITICIRCGRNLCDVHRFPEYAEVAGDLCEPCYEKGRDLMRINDRYRDRPQYYVLDEQGEPVPIGRGHGLTREEVARWLAFKDDVAARTLEETIIPNPEHPTHPVVVHTTFVGMDLSDAFPLPDGAPALWETSLLDKPPAEVVAGAEAKAEEGDGSGLLDDEPPAPPEVVALAGKLGLDVEAFEEWRKVYGTREAALQGHAETVRWVRRALGVS
jgi:hypothetical protein